MSTQPQKLTTQATDTSTNIPTTPPSPHTSIDQTSNIPNATTRPQDSKKLLSLLSTVVVVALICLAAVLYFQSQSPELPTAPQPLNPGTTPPQTQSLQKYTNQVAGFSFEYPDSLGLQWAGQSETPETAMLVNLSPKEDLGVKGLSFEIVNTPKAQAYNSKELVVKSILDARVSSTAFYQNPQNNKVAETPQNDGSYWFEVSWSNPAAAQNQTGSDIIRVYPIDNSLYPLSAEQSTQERFLLVLYPKEKASLYEAIINSLQLADPIKKQLGYVFQVSDEHKAELQAAFADLGLKSDFSGILFESYSPIDSSASHVIAYDTTGKFNPVFAKLTPGSCVSLDIRDLKLGVENTVYNGVGLATFTAVQPLDTFECYRKIDRSEDYPVVEVTSQVFAHKRPVFDIAEDYSIRVQAKVAESYGYEDMSGVPLDPDKMLEVAASPVSTAVAKDLYQAKLSKKPVTLKGSFEAGYSETMYFLVTAVVR